MTVVVPRAKTSPLRERYPELSVKAFWEVAGVRMTLPVAM